MFCMDLHIRLGPSFNPVFDVGESVDVIPQGRQLWESLQGLIAELLLETGHNLCRSNVGPGQLEKINFQYILIYISTVIR